MHDDEHHAHDDGSHLDDIELRVRALETLLAEKGYVDPAALDVFIETYETKIGPRNGAQGRRQGLDRSGLPELAARRTPPRRSPRSAISGRQGEHMVALENTPDIHNMVVCTLCSCYPVAGARPAAGLVQVARPTARAP